MSIYKIIARLKWFMSLVEEYMLQYLGWDGWPTVTESESESETEV